MSHGRRFHKDSRLSENFTEQGLQSLTGESRRKWTRYVVKELVDNSLGAAEGYADTPAVTVDVETIGEMASKVSKVSVRDNGPGISKSDIATIFEDISAFAGSKRHYALPTRGNQGNALMTILGIQYLSGGPLVVETNGTRHLIQVEQSATDEWKINRETEPTDVDGTRIVVDFDSAYYCRTRTIEPTLAAFVALNPHVKWTLSVGAFEKAFEPSAESTVERFSTRGSATTGKTLWFSYDDFMERLKADARTDERLTVNDVVSEFAKLTSTQKRQSVFAGLEDIRNMPLREFLESQSDAYRKTLYENMCDETSSYSERGLDSTLGSVGNNLTHSLHNYLRFIGRYSDVAQLATNVSEYSDGIEAPEDMTLYYSGGTVVDDEDMAKTVPFYFEMTVIPKADESASTEIEFGINQSVAYSTPNVSVGFTNNGIEYNGYSIKAALTQATDHPYHIVTNLTCPNLDFQDKGKQSFDTEPFEEVVSDVVRKAVSKIQRDIRPRLNELRSEDDPEPEELPNKAPRGFISDFVETHFEEAYHEATEGGKYTIEMRQLFYVMRPIFQRVKKQRGYKYASTATIEDQKPLELDYDYFSQLVAEYETEQLGQRVVHRDNRGFFVEPHSNKRIDLETVDVQQYQPDLDKFDTLLFVEKTGFFKLIHQDFELTKKYDIGLINSKGYSTIAGRKLIENVQKRGDVDLLTLTDLDINGLGIADDATEADELSVVDEFEATRLGITLSDVEAYELPVESRDYTAKQVTQLENRVEKGLIDEAVAEFFAADGGKAVEINALNPAELRTYLTDKFDEYGVSKVKPAEEDIDDPDELQQEAIAEAVGKWVLSETKTELTDSVEESLNEEETSRQEIQSRIIGQLEQQPPKGWQDVEENIQEEITDEWQEKAREYLDENATVDVEIE